MACNHNQDPGQNKARVLVPGTEERCLYTVQRRRRRRQAWGGGAAKQLSEQQQSLPLPLPLPLRCEGYEAWCGVVGNVVWSGMVWCGVPRLFCCAGLGPVQSA